MTPRIAFYAPMKPLDHPVPSGDRQLGRLIRRALMEAGHDVAIGARTRTWSRHGGPEQETLRDAAEAEAETVIAEWHGAPSPPADLWFTYHLYHKAPDWIGPRVADAFGLPYVVAEASRALKQEHGPWALGFASADTALKRASAVIALHQEDADGLSAVVPAERIRLLPPFIDTTAFAERPATSGPHNPVRLLTIAMMRAGDKERSYRVLADALNRLAAYPWSLTIAGDGEAAERLRPLFPPDRTTWLGRVDPDRVPDLCGQSDVFVWPAVNEAFGLVFLEAQAAGLAVVGGRSGGVPDLVEHGTTGYLAPEGDAAGFADALRILFDHPDRIPIFGRAGQSAVLAHHGLKTGGASLSAILKAVAGDDALSSSGQKVS